MLHGLSQWKQFLMSMLKLWMRCNSQLFHCSLSVKAAFFLHSCFSSFIFVFSFVFSFVFCFVLLPALAWLKGWKKYEKISEKKANWYTVAFGYSFLIKEYIFLYFYMDYWQVSTVPGGFWLVREGLSFHVLANLIVSNLWVK